MKRTLVLVAVACAGALLAFALRKNAAPSTAERQGEHIESSADRQPPHQPTPGETVGAAGRPTITRIVEEKVAQDDPRAPDYDALRLSQMISVSNFELFEREPRNDIWASGMEQALDDVLVEALGADFEGAEVTSVECRTQSCVVSLAVDDERARSLYSYAQAYMLLGSSMKASFGELGDGKRAMQFALLYDKRFGDADGYVDWRRRIISAQETQRERLRRELLGLAAGE